MDQRWSVRPAFIAGDCGSQRRRPSIAGRRKVLTARVKSYTIFPDTRRPEHDELFGKPQRFTREPGIHVTGGQIGTLDVGRSFAGERQDTPIPVDNPEVYFHQMPLIIALLDHLSLVPIRAGLFVGRWTPLSLISRDLSVDSQKRFAMPPHRPR
jgi:hypothetical protein